MTINVTIWNEGWHERNEPDVAERYPEGLHGAIGQGLVDHLGDNVKVTFATLYDPDQGLPESVLETTDVLIWWSHMRQEEVEDDLVARIHARILRGMGFIGLHSATKSKIFRRLMSTTCCVRWRHGEDRELVWTIKPDHPIAQGLPEFFSIPAQEMFGEFFDIPDPDELVFLSTFSGGEVLRSGLCYRRGYGRVFYFSPGDQAYPVYYDKHIRKVLANAVDWASPRTGIRETDYLSRRSEPGWIEMALATGEGR